MITPDGHISIGSDGIFALCVIGFFVVAVLITAMLNSRPTEDTRREITDWRPICNEHELMQAINDTSHRGRHRGFHYGQVGSQIGYVITDECHILFNMMWVRQLAPETAEAYGPARMVIIYTASSVAGFLLSSMAGAWLPFLPRFVRGAFFTVGASAPIFGLLGALVRYGQKRGSSAVGRQMLGYAAVLGLMGFVMPGVDNWAHLGGFAGGWVAATILDPWKEERVDHVLVALLCLAATVASVIASIATGLPVLR